MFLLAFCSHLFEFKTASEHLRHVLEDKVLVEEGSVDLFVVEEDTTVILLGSVSKVDVEEAWDNNQEDEESATKDLNLVLLLKEEPGHGNGDIVRARAIGVAVLAEVLTGSLVSQDLHNERISLLISMLPFFGEEKRC